MYTVTSKERISTVSFSSLSPEVTLPTWRLTFKDAVWECPMLIVMSVLSAFKICRPESVFLDGFSQQGKHIWYGHHSNKPTIRAAGINFNFRSEISGCRATKDCYKDCDSSFATGAEILKIAIPPTLNIACSSCSCVLRPSITWNVPTALTYCRLDCFSLSWSKR
jgi:hypothetical protein